MVMIMTKKDKVTELMKTFCSDALRELNSYDTKLRNRIVKGYELSKNFYQKYPKGLYIYSITEPIIKWIIYTNLIDKYCMLPEHKTSNGKFLDLALYSKSKPCIDKHSPDIAIEMKWVSFKKNGTISENYRKGMVDDAIKLHKLGSEYDYKYIMQFAVLNENHYRCNW